MPAKPAWFGKLDAAIAHLASLPRSWVDRAIVEFVLEVGPRRAQQIMAPCVTERVGPNGLADRDCLMAHLRHLAQGDSGYYERQRRRKLGRQIEQLRQNWLQTPKLLVEAPVSTVNQGFEELPEGVDLEPGRILIRFETPQQALEKLLALAMAIGNDLDRFERLSRV